jgi:hypothetical protein
VKFKAETDYYPFRMKESLPVVKRAVAVVSAIGGTPTIRAANGGLDANWMVRHGVPTVTFGAGQNEPHTIDEWIIGHRVLLFRFQLVPFARHARASDSKDSWLPLSAMQ